MSTPYDGNMISGPLSEKPNMSKWQNKSMTKWNLTRSEKQNNSSLCGHPPPLDLRNTQVQYCTFLYRTFSGKNANNAQILYER